MAANRIQSLQKQAGRMEREVSRDVARVVAERSP
jgi:hypothetical protein